MSECERCLTEKQTVQIGGEKMELCLHTGCIMDKWLEQYEGCAHNLEPQKENLLKCTKCGMGATPSYLNNDNSG